MTGNATRLSRTVILLCVTLAVTAYVHSSHAQQNQGGLRETLNTIDEDPHLQPVKDPVAIEGGRLLAFDISWRAMSKIKKAPNQLELDLRNFYVTFNEDRDNYYIHFTPHSSYEKRKDGSILLEIGGRNKYGRDLRYTVSKNGMKIMRVQKYQ